MAVGGVDHNQIDAGIDQRHGALEPVLADTGGGADAQSALFVLTGVRIGLGLLHILDGDQPDTAEGLVDHQQLLDAELMQEAPRLFGRHAFPHRDQIFLGHKLGNRLLAIGGETDVTIGQDTDQPAIPAFDHRNAGDAMMRHQDARLGQGLVGMDGDRIDHHAALIALDPANLFGLRGDVEILMDDAQAAGLRQRDGQTAFRDGVHGRRNQWNA